MKHHFTKKDIVEIVVSAGCAFVAFVFLCPKFSIQTMALISLGCGVFSNRVIKL